MNALRTVVPAPLLSAALFAVWIMLADAASKGQLVLGAVLALVLPILTSRVRPVASRVRRPFVAIRYVATVAYDVVRSNIEVARGVLLFRKRQPQSQFVVIPLDLRDPVGVAILAMVTTVVPGTVWSETSLDGRRLMLHVWDVPDEAAFIEHYKARYEFPLREIFE